MNWGGLGISGAGGAASGAQPDSGNKEAGEKGKNYIYHVLRCHWVIFICIKLQYSQ